MIGQEVERADEGARQAGDVSNDAELAAADGSVNISSVAAVPALSVIVLDAGVDVSPGDVNWSVYAPVVPVIASPANVASPDPFVFAVALVREGVPPGSVAITAVIVTPAVLTAFPLWSRSWIAGWVGIAMPLCAAAPG